MVVVSRLEVMESECELRLYTIWFLNELDNDFGYTRYYKKDISSRYRQFCGRYQQATRYRFQDLLSYMKRRKLVYVNRKQVVLKNLFINVEQGAHLVFTIRSCSESSGEHYVCQICDCGFSSTHGLATHQNSESHKQQLATLKNSIQNGSYRCPMLECNYRGQNSEDLARHFERDKGVKVSKDPESDDVKLDNGRQRRAFCELCHIMCTSELSLEQHKKGKKHLVNAFRELYRESRNNLITDKERVKVVFESDGDMNPGALLVITGGQDTEQTVKLKIQNTGVSVKLTSFVHFHLYNPQMVVLSDVAGVAGGASHVIPARASYDVCVTFRPTYFGRIRIPLLFTFQRTGTEFKILREILFKCVTNPIVYAEIQPVAPYVKPEPKKPDELDIVASDVKADYSTKMALEQVLRLKRYPVSPEVRDARGYIAAGKNEIEATERWNEIQFALQLDHLDYDNYAPYFHHLLHLEEDQMNHDIYQYTMEGVPMRKEARTELIVVKVPGLAENRPSVLKGDKLFAIRDPMERVKFEGSVHKTELTEVKLTFAKRFVESFIQNMKCKIEFTINRWSLRLEHRGVSKEMIRAIEGLLFPSPRTRPLPTFSPLRFFNKDVENNHEQSGAVKHIVAGTSLPAPYLIYGPPGTGKTFTLVEVIKQVYREMPHCRILACAPQNAAADLLTKRLLDHVDKNDILRLNAPSRSYDGIVETAVQRVSNYAGKSAGAPAGHARRALFGGAAASSDMEVEFPKKEVLEQKRILVTTLVTSGRLVSAEMAGHFTHIFIDEAGHATEPETVIPLSGLLTEWSHVQVVLTGDPKQLGPIIRSPLAAKLGKSLLERLMDTQAYRRDRATGSFNQNYVTKLVRSFRSHPEILEVPNSCFYDNELQAHADKLQRERFCQWEGLPKKGFPLIFHGVNGHEEREGSSPSWFNNDEVMQAVKYVELLMDCKSPRVRPEHIGIISPYHQQVNKITRGLKALETQARGRTRNYANIKVGSVENFQGDEREVIIISTVRSQDAYLTHDKDYNIGFVGSPKRFNVAVTRAKALLILIGNPSILRRDRNWLRLISHIEEGGGYVGCPPPDELETGNVEDLTQMMDSLQLKDSLSQSASEHQLQGDQEWRRKE